MSPPDGHRPVPTRGVFAIEQEQLVLPDPLALDTSFVVEALLATQPLHGACDAFLTRILDSGVTVVTSELLRVELAETAFAIALKERWGRRWRGHRADGRSRRPATRRLNHTLSRHDEIFGSLRHISVRIGQVPSSVPALMADYGIASYDAVHAASAIAAGAQAIVTLDTGFALLPASQLVVYTDRSRLASCRKKRPRR
jgi:predicted nucleic acid-binding protein